MKEDEGNVIAPAGFVHAIVEERGFQKLPLRLTERAASFSYQARK
jgi:hypothetical protein